MCGLINKKILVFFQGANQNLIVAHLFYCYVFYFKKYFWTIFKVYWICYNIASVLVLIFWQGIWDLSGGASGKEPTSQCRRHLILGFDPWVRKIPWRRAWQSTPVFLPGKSLDRGAWQAAWGCKELDMAEATEQQLQNKVATWKTSFSLHFILFWPHQAVCGILSSLTRYWTHTPYSEISE